MLNANNPLLCLHIITTQKNQDQTADNPPITIYFLAFSTETIYIQPKYGLNFTNLILLLELLRIRSLNFLRKYSYPALHLKSELLKLYKFIKSVNFYQEVSIWRHPSKCACLALDRALKILLGAESVALLPAIKNILKFILLVLCPLNL